MVDVVLVEGYGVRLRVHRRSLVVEERGERGRERRIVALRAVDRVVVLTGGVSVSSAALRALARSGVSLLVLDADGQPLVSLEPPYLTATAETRLAQYRARMDPLLRLRYAADMVSAKMLSQAAFLRRLGTCLGERWLLEEARRVEELAARAHSARGLEELRGLEARAARRYWGGYAATLPRELGFRGRDHDSGDPVNRSLNYLYGVLYHEAFRSLAVHGLDPYVGFLHVERSGSPSLVFDFVEMFRVAFVDAPLYEALRAGFRPVVEGTGYLSRETRRALIRLFYDSFSRGARGDGGGRVGGVRLLSVYARRLASSLRRGTGYRGYVGVTLGCGS